MSKVKAGDTISVHYTGTLEDGTVFDTSKERDPLQFEVSSGMMIPGFDAAVLDMAAGDNKTVNIVAEEAYGEAREEMVATFPRTSFPEEIDPEIGQQLALTTPSGQPLNVIVTKVEGDDITLDGNHFLAGKDLTFEIEVVEILNSSEVVEEESEEE
jgi:peptidylprolyl isomerase